MSSRYEDMGALEALKKANAKSLLLPDIQREYVWDVTEIEALFESIVDGYPIGSCIFWKTTRKNINEQKPSLYYFFSKFEREKTKNEKVSIPLSEEQDYYIVLDGQQRITSLNIALNGSYKYYKGGRGHDRKNPKFWVEKELYYNLQYYAQSADDDEHPRKRFVFLTEDEAKAGSYYKVKSLLQYDDSDGLVEELLVKGIEKRCRTDLSRLLRRLTDSSGKGLIHYYCIDEESYDAALNIFIRVNSTGRKLSKSDLLFSTLIDGWENGKENVEKLIDVMNNKGDGFLFTRDYLMRTCLVLTGGNPNLKIDSLTGDAIQAIRDHWPRIKSSLDEMSSLLNEIGMSHENLTSYNATMPVALYLFKGGKIKTTESRQEVRKFLSVSLAKRMFGVASNTALTSTRAAIAKVDCTKTPFSLSLFQGVSLVGGRTFDVDEREIDRWLDTYEKGQNTYVLLSLLYPHLKLSQVSFHQDHCHPYAGFEKKAIAPLGLSDEKMQEWKKKRNLLPNLQFLAGPENQSKNKTPLKDWVTAGNEFEYHPAGISLELADFDAFFDARRQLIKKQLMSLFGISFSDADGALS